MLSDQAVQKLEAIAKESRRNILKMIFAAKSGHPGGSLSEIDILTALYFDVMKVDPENPRWEGRDRFHSQQGPRLSRPICHLGGQRLFPGGGTSNLPAN